MGAWARLEAWLDALVKDRARLARWLLIGYWISTAFVVIGTVVALLVLTGRWPF
ncbi:MAG TPA: hypothetical protein VHH36_08250 [Candidatus Thermoplasmatota archaeon]|nr:hypothetical protein [Candidatus Thermoplasmatota archaeon]